VRADSGRMASYVHMQLRDGHHFGVLAERMPIVCGRAGRLEFESEFHTLELKLTLQKTAKSKDNQKTAGVARDLLDCWTWPLERSA